MGKDAPYFIDKLNSDGYKPHVIPKALTVIKGYKEEQIKQNERGNEMLEQTVSVVKAIQCVYLPATNIEESARWYVEHLGLKLLRPVNENQAQLGISSEQTIFLIKSKEPENVNYTEVGGSEQCILTLEVEKFEGLHSKMKNNGVSVSNIEDNAGCGLNFYAYDPAGNKIDLWSGWPK